MAWVRVPPEHHPLFHAALPNDPRVETMKMFGGVAAKVNGHIFAGLFGRSTVVALPEPERAEALALEGAEYFDPMGDGRARSEKVMLPEAIMHDDEALRAWIGRAFRANALLPAKAPKTARAARAAASVKIAKAAKAAKVARTPKVATAVGSAAEVPPAARAPAKPATKATTRTKPATKATTRTTPAAKATTRTTPTAKPAPAARRSPTKKPEKR